MVYIKPEANMGDALKVFLASVAAYNDGALNRDEIAFKGEEPYLIVKLGKAEDEKFMRKIRDDFTTWAFTVLKGLLKLPELLV